LVQITSFLDYKKGFKYRLFGMEERVGMLKNSWLMLRKYELSSRTTSGRGITDYPKIL